MAAKWTALAEQLDDDAREPGFGAAASYAAACAAGIDPVIPRGLVGAALALTCGDARRSLWERQPPCEDADMLTTWTENLDADITVLLARCEDLGEAAGAEYEAAAEQRARALAAASAAAAGMLGPEDGRDAAAAALAAAEDAAEEAGHVMADCETALEVAGDLDGRLRYARDQVRPVPAVHDEVYEAPVALAAAGGRMPFSGSFIAPGTAALRGAA